MTNVIKKEEIIKYLLHKQLLLNPRNIKGYRGIEKVFNNMRMIQYDPQNPCGRSIDISLQARIKDYQPDAAYATAVRMYNPNTEAWDILYTELGGATQLEGKREGNRIVQTEINEKNIQWVFSEITTTSFRWQRMVKRPDGTWETEAELFAVRR